MEVLEYEGQPVEDVTGREWEPLVAVPVPLPGACPGGQDSVILADEQKVTLPRKRAGIT